MSKKQPIICDILVTDDECFFMHLKKSKNTEGTK